MSLERWADGPHCSAVWKCPLTAVPETPTSQFALPCDFLPRVGKWGPSSLETRDHQSWEVFLNSLFNSFFSWILQLYFSLLVENYLTTFMTFSSLLKFRFSCSSSPAL